MPTKIEDLTGRRFGRLTVLGRGGRVKCGRWQQGWLCRCDCGAELTVPQYRLPYADWIASRPCLTVDACPACRAQKAQEIAADRTQKCAVCGAPLGYRRRVTCPGDCAEVHRKERWRTAWQRRAAKSKILSQESSHE